MRRGAAGLVIGCVAIAGCGAPAASPGTPMAPVSSSVWEVTGTAPAGAVVSLAPAGTDVPMPDGPAVLDQYAKQFVPGVLYVRVGQPVDFRNTEDMGHNVTVNRRSSGTSVFDVETDPQEKYVHTFDRVGQYDVLCSVHPGMQATVIATDSPLATVSDEGGRFAIANVSAGAYTLSVTFEGRTVTTPVDVKGPRTDVRVTR